MIGRVSGRPVAIAADSAQKGDMRHTFADTSRAKTDLGFAPRVQLESRDEPIAGTRVKCDAAGEVSQRPVSIDLDAARRALESYTRRTVCTATELTRALAKIRERGWADEVEELSVGVAGVAAPIRGQGGLVVGAIGITGAVDRICDRFEALWAEEAEPRIEDLLESCDLPPSRHAAIALDSSTPDHS